jgi:alternate signal-mediated exported protein
MNTNARTHRRTRTKGVIAMGVGGALLLGGGTFALWSDSDAFDGGTITAGNLDVAAIATPTWQDVSADVVGAPTISLSTFRIVPGDTIQGTFGVDAALQGDNLTADLLVDLDEASGDLLASTDGVTLTYSLQTAAGVPVDGATDVPVGSTSTISFASADNPNAGTLPTLPAALDSAADYQVVVKAAFDAGTPDQIRVLDALDLGSIAVTLQQTRA